MCPPSLWSANPNSKWFRFYSRALVESDPDVARVYVKKALDAIDKKLSQPGLESKELHALSAAVHYLHLIEIEHEELRRKAA